MSKQCTSKNFLASVLLATGFLAAPIAQASLVNNGGGLIYDTDLNITWISDGNYAKTSGAQTGDGTMSLDGANLWAAGLTFQNVSGWALPTETQLHHLFFGELGGQTHHSIADVHNQANYALFENVQAAPYWSTTPSGGFAFYIDFGSGTETLTTQTTGLYAFAVHAGNVPAVPEPETYAMLLAGLGLVGFIGRRRKQIS